MSKELQLDIVQCVGGLRPGETRDKTTWLKEATMRDGCVSPCLVRPSLFIVYILLICATLFLYRVVGGVLRYC